MSNFERRKFVVTTSSKDIVVPNPPINFFDFQQYIAKELGIQEFRLQYRGANLDPIQYQNLRGAQTINLIDDPYTFTEEELKFEADLDEVVRIAKQKSEEVKARNN